MVTMLFFCRQWEFSFIANGEGVFKIKGFDIFKKSQKKFVFLNRFYYILKQDLD